MNLMYLHLQSHPPLPGSGPEPPPCMFSVTIHWPDLDCKPTWESVPFPKEFIPLRSFAIISLLWFPVVADGTFADSVLPRDFHAGLLFQVHVLPCPSTGAAVAQQRASVSAGDALMLPPPPAGALLWALPAADGPASTFLLSARWGSVKGLPLLPSVDPKGLYSQQPTLRSFPPATQPLPQTDDQTPSVSCPSYGPKAHGAQRGPLGRGSHSGRGGCILT